MLIQTPLGLTEVGNNDILYGDLTATSTMANFSVNGAQIPAIDVQAMIPGSKWLMDNRMQLHLVDPDGKLLNAYEMAKVLFEERIKNSAAMEHIIKEVTYALRKKLGFDNFTINNTNGILYITYNGETHSLTDSQIDDSINLTDLIEDITENSETIVDVNGQIHTPDTIILKTSDGFVLNEFFKGVPAWKQEAEYILLNPANLKPEI